MLPFYFEYFQDYTLLTNDVGDFIQLPVDFPIADILNGNINEGTEIYKDLYGKYFVKKENLPEVLNLLAVRYRTRKQFLFEFTSLHMVVLTKKCNQHCTYCHASSTRDGIDMSKDTVEKCIDVILQLPAKCIKIEFQGGEPTKNFDVLQHAIFYAKQQNKLKEIEFVVCSNLYEIDDEYLKFFKDNNVQISTSLDGNEALHNCHRIDYDKQGTYKKVTTNIKKLQSQVGQQSVSALLTVTRNNLNGLETVVREYLDLGMKSIFIRSLNRLGYANSEWEKIGYTSQEFITAYSKILEYIIQINLSGIYFPELFASILLSRILIPFSTGFVDLQSPAGVGIQGVIYDVNGDVLVSDEARMYRNMTGNDSFTIGNVHSNSLQQIFGNSKLKDIIGQSIIETLPMCETCVFQPYCGSDPIKNYSLENDLISFKPTDDFCYKMKSTFKILFDYIIKGNNDIRNVLLSWVTGRTLT